MRIVDPPQFQIGVTPIGQIQFDPKDRDDIPRVLQALQHLYIDDSCRRQIFLLLQQAFGERTNLKVGRPGMQLWRVLVLAVLKEGLNIDFDRLVNLANHHFDVRRMLGLGSWDDDYRFQLQTVIDNVSRLTPKWLSKINEVVVRSGHERLDRKSGQPFGGRVDSFVVETHVHYPTDVNLLWDAMRALIGVCWRASLGYRIGGWRQHKYHQKMLKASFNKTRKSKQQKRSPQSVVAYLQHCEMLLDKAQQTLIAVREVADAGCHQLASIGSYMAHGRRQIEQVDRRLLRGEKIASEEKVYSIFEPHTRWICKGKAGVTAELGVPIAVVEDQYQFIVHHQILWQQHDTEVAVALIEAVQRRYPEFRACSFDRGFHSPSNRVRLDALLDLNALPKKGKLSQADWKRENSEAFSAARQQHPAVESAINNLEQRGLDRVRTHGRDGFARTVGLSVLAANLHRIGKILHRQEKERLRRAKRKRLKIA